MKKLFNILTILGILITISTSNILAQDCDCGKLVEANFQIKGPKDICIEKCDSYLTFSVNSFPLECYKYSWVVTNTTNSNVINIGGNGTHELVIKCGDFKGNQSYNIELTVSCGGKSITVNHPFYAKKCERPTESTVEIKTGRDAVLRSNQGGNIAPRLSDKNFGKVPRNWISTWKTSGELPNQGNGGIAEACFLLDFKWPKDLLNGNQIVKAEIQLYEHLLPFSANLYTGSSKLNNFYIQLADAWVEGTGTGGSIVVMGGPNAVSYESYFGLTPTNPITIWPTTISTAGQGVAAAMPPTHTGSSTTGNGVMGTDNPLINVTQLLKANFNTSSFNGFLFTFDHGLGNSSSTRGRTFGSFQDTDISKRPKLILTYNP